MIKKIFFLLVLIFPFTSLEAKKPLSVGKEQVLKVGWSTGLKTGKSKKRFYPEQGSPVSCSGRVFVGTHSGLFYAFETTKGKSLWSFKSNGPIASKPVCQGDVVYFGNNKGTVYALDAASGTKLWENYVGGEVLAEPTLGGSALFVVTTSRDVYALAKSDGQELWTKHIRGFEKKFTMRGNSPAVLAGSSLYIGFADGQVVALSASNGGEEWSADLATNQASFKDVDAAIVVDGNFLYIAGYYGQITKLQRGSGQVVWKNDLQTGSTMQDDGSHLYVTTQQGTVAAIRKTDGSRFWEVKIGGTLSAPALFGNNILVGSESENAYVLEKETGRILQKVNVTPGFSSEANVSDEGIFILSSSGTIYNLRLLR